MAQPAVEIFYVVPLGGVIAWYPLAKAEFPPNFAYCDGKTVSDPDSPYHGLATPNLTNCFPMGSGNGVAVGQTGGVLGWDSGTINPGSTQMDSNDNQQNPSTVFPAPGWVAFNYIMRIK
jgi:hypothetical protein